MLRDYGSDLPSLVDQPINRVTLAAIRADIVKALNKWEPRMRLDQVVLQSVEASGAVTMDLTLTWLPTGEPVALSGVTI